MDFKNSFSFSNVSSIVCQLNLYSGKPENISIFIMPEYYTGKLLISHKKSINEYLLGRLNKTKYLINPDDTLIKTQKPFQVWVCLDFMENLECNFIQLNEYVKSIHCPESFYEFIEKLLKKHKPLT